MLPSPVPPRESYRAPHEQGHAPREGVRVPIEQGELVQTLKLYGVGIDCHSKFIQVCVLVRDTDICVRRWEQEFSTAWPALRAAADWASRIILQQSPDPFVLEEPLAFTLESTGTYHLPVIKAFAGIPSIINPLLAASTGRKTDKLDARKLAYHAITGLWPPSYQVSEEIQQARVLWHCRGNAMRAATKISNQINSDLLRFGHTIGATCSVKSAEGRAIIEDLCHGHLPARDYISPAGLPEPIREVILDLYAQYDEQKRKQQAYEKRALAYMKSLEWPLEGRRTISGADLFALLQTVPAIGEVTAAVWLLEICDPFRFPTKKALAAFAGSDPSVKVSAGKVTSTVHRGGNAHLRSALKQAATSLINRHNEPFGQWGWNIVKRNSKRGGFKRGTNAVARRLALGLWYVHRKCEPFSYAQYGVMQEIHYPEVTLDAMGISPRLQKKLHRMGFTTSTLLVAAYQQDLASTKGIGEKCLNEIHSWMERMKACSLKERW